MDLPLSHDQCLKATNWLKSNFGAKMLHAVKDTPFTVDVICAIACQETAYAWIHFVDKLTPDIILARCVYDASGDVENTYRNAFPKNKADFLTKYSEEFTHELITEANLTRAMRNLQPAEILYKGYGIFQYDLQFILTDPNFFIHKLWYQFDNCLSRLMIELNRKYQKHGEVWLTIQRYNGRGIASENYRNNVKQFTDWIKAA